MYPFLRGNIPQSAVFDRPDKGGYNKKHQYPLNLWTGGGAAVHDILKSCELKNTKTRKLVLELLEQTHIPVSAEELYDRARAMGASLSLATVYRTLSVLTERGAVLKQSNRDGKTYYQLNDHHHKHFLVCTVCGEIVQVDACPLCKLEEELAKSTGYRITGHSLEFMGTCPRCQKGGKEKP